jgi:hypothetical protein
LPKNMGIQLCKFMFQMSVLPAWSTQSAVNHVWICASENETSFFTKNICNYIRIWSFRNRMISTEPHAAHRNRYNYESYNYFLNNLLYLDNVKKLNLHLLLNVLISLVISTSGFL